MTDKKTTKAEKKAETKKASELSEEELEKAQGGGGIYSAGYGFKDVAYKGPARPS